MRSSGILANIFLFFIFIFPQNAAAEKMDLFLKMAAQNSDKGAILKSVSSDAPHRSIACFLKTNDVEATRKAVLKVGGKFLSSTSSIVSAKIPATALDKISKMNEILFMELAQPLSNKMNTARFAGKVDLVQDGSALGVAYTGKNVVVGIVDDALDYSHPDFLNAQGTSRIQYLRQPDGNRTIECTKRSLNNNSCEIESGGQSLLHGTHVTGIAAGGNDVYTGVAPEADIMFSFLSVSDAYTDGTNSTSFATAVLEGAAAIFSKADTIDKAAVINLSLGTSLGAHDGTSLMEEGLGELIADRPGRIIVGAAGNEQVDPAEWPVSHVNYIGGIHASINAETNTNKASRLVIWNGAGSVAAFTGGTAIDLWLDPDQKDTCSIAVYGYTGGRESVDFNFPGVTNTADSTFASGDIALGEDTVVSAVSDDGKVKLTFTVDSSDTRNNKPHALILIEPDTAGSGNAGNLRDYWYDIVIRSNEGPCTGHMWVYFDYPTYHNFLKNVAGIAVADGPRGEGYILADGDSFYTTTIPATARDVLAIGSWLAEKPIASGLSQWTSIDGQIYDQNNVSSPGGTGSAIDDLSSFSSLGPSADGREKPDVVAPGEPIISAKAGSVTVSRGLQVNEHYYKSAGTSMAAPYITGVIALLLEKNNTLKTAEVRTAIGSGAIADGLIAKTAVAANSYGAGKVDAVGVLSSVGEDRSAYNGTGDLEPSGGGSCAIMKHSRSPSSFHLSPFTFELLIPLLVCLGGAVLVFAIAKRRT